MAAPIPDEAPVTRTMRPPGTSVGDVRPSWAVVESADVMGSDTPVLVQRQLEIGDSTRRGATIFGVSEGT